MSRFDELTNVVKKHFLISDIILGDEGWFILPNTLEWQTKLRMGSFYVAFEKKSLKVPSEDITPEDFDIILTMGKL